MENPPPSNRRVPAADHEAAAWMSRLDRGLTPAEQDEFFTWLSAHPDHTASLNRARRRWRKLDQLADWRPEFGLEPNPDLLAPRPRAAGKRAVLTALLAAACLAVALFVWPRGGFTAREPVGAAAAKPEDRRTLPDESVVKLNAGAAHVVLYSPTERRVRLERGEAFFMVTKDPNRPFLVEAGGATVRALGTSFNVRLVGGELEVLVAEGRVEVAPPVTTLANPGITLAPDATVLGASQRVSLSLASPATPGQVATLTRREIQHTLEWQHGLMTFQDKPLAGIIDELNRLNDQQLQLVDEALATMRFSGTIHSDNVEGFVRLLQTSFGAEATRQPDGMIQLRTRAGVP